MCQCFLNHQLVADSQVATLNYHHRLCPSSSSSWNISLRKKSCRPLYQALAIANQWRRQVTALERWTLCPYHYPCPFMTLFHTFTCVYSPHIQFRIRILQFRQNATPLFQQQHLSQFALTARSSSLMLLIDLIKIIFLIKIMIIVII